MVKPNRNILPMGRPLKGSQINWNQVYYFSEIAAAGSIKEAADKLELTSSTLSLHLSQLEEDLKVQLFYRHHRKLVLTPEGTRLFHHAKEMFEAGQRLVDVVSPVSLGCYPVSVGLVPSPSVTIANYFLGKYIENQPALNMKLFHSGYDDLEKGLSGARFDFGFSDRLPDHKDLVHHRISQSNIKFYVSSKWQGTPFSQLILKVPLLICNAEPSQKSFAERALFDADLHPTAVVTSDYPSSLLELCLQGIGIGVFSEASVQRLGLEALRSLRVPPDAPKLQDQLFVLWAKEAENTAAVRTLKQVLVEEAEFGRT